MTADVLIQAQNKSYVPRIIEYYEKFVWNSIGDEGPLQARFAFPEPSLASSTSSSSATTTTTIATTGAIATSSSPSPSPSPLRGRLGTSLVELSRGARGGRGPGLVLVRGVTCPPAEFIEWLRWWSPLPRAVARLYWLGRERKEEEEEEERKEEEEGGDGTRNSDDDGDFTLAGFSASTAAGLASKLAAITKDDSGVDAADDDDEKKTCSSPSPSRSPPLSPSLAFLLKEKRIPVRIMAVPRSLERLLIDSLCDDADKGGAGWNLDPRAGEKAGDGGEGGEGGKKASSGGGGGLFVVAAAMDGLNEEGAEETKDGGGGGGGGGGGSEQQQQRRGQHDPPVPRPRYRAAIVWPPAVLADTTEQRSRASRPSKAEWKLSEALAMSSGLLLPPLLRLPLPLPLPLQPSMAKLSLAHGGNGGGNKEDGEEEEEEEEALAATTRLLSEVLATATTAPAPPSTSSSSSPISSSYSDLIAVDVGAVPGGWTRHLALSLRARCVVALDPSPNLDPDVAALRNVRHVRMRSGDEGAVDAVAAAVVECSREESSSSPLSPPPRLPLAHLLTCDANEPPVAASEAILPLLPLLRRGALVVLTLKLRFPGRDKGFATRAATERLGPAGLELLGDPWLFANTMYERTLLLRKR